MTADWQSRAETAEARLAEVIKERDEAAEAEEILSGLLRRRFPQRPDGSYPDYDIVGMLRGYEAAETKLAMVSEAAATLIRSGDGALVGARGDWNGIPAKGIPPSAIAVSFDGLRSALAATSEQVAAWVARIKADERKPLLAVIALDDHFGYEADRDWQGVVTDWYCRDSKCSQPEGKPHLDACTVGPALAAIRAMGDS